MSTVAECRKLNLNKIKDRIADTISTTDSLKDVLPVDWSDDVLSGDQKVIITKESSGK